MPETSRFSNHRAGITPKNENNEVRFGNHFLFPCCHTQKKLETLEKIHGRKFKILSGEGGSALQILALHLGRTCPD